VFEATIDHGLAKPALYDALAASLASLLDGETDALANLANASGLLAETLERVNWCGFYLLRGGELVLGPFQGRPACVRIALGKGVCGTAAQKRESLVVPDVNAFPGHIACDAASPVGDRDPDRRRRRALRRPRRRLPDPGRFDDEDRSGLEHYVRVLTPRVAWEQLGCG
jgi:GAF domain-containing protein